MISFLDFLTPFFEFFHTTIGLVLFIPFYALWVTLLLPGAWLTIFAGAIYGTWLASSLVFIGAFLGAQITFFLGRTLLKDWTQKKLDKIPKLKALEKAITTEGLKLVFLTRLSPAFPFSLLNLVFGVSNVSNRNFTLGLIAILPGTILYTTFGNLAGDIARLSDLISKQNINNPNWLNFIGLISTILTVWLVTRATRSFLQVPE